MSKILVTNVRVFTGRDEVLTGPMCVRIDGNTFGQVIPMSSWDSTEASPDVVAIDGTGMTLIPGLIDAHAHLSFSSIPAASALTADTGYLAIRGAQEATQTLLRGFTSLRDAGGPSFGIKLAIDQGVVKGPRIYPSGSFISQTAGHGDFRMPYEIPRGTVGCLSHTELMGAAAIADGVDEVLRASREQLMRGASQLKVMAGGGVSSHYDPLDVTQYTEREVRAAVDAADNWGTYVLVHAYTSHAVQQAVRAGVKCIDHGHLVDEETVAMMADHDVWWSLQPFLDDEDAIPMGNPLSRAKQLLVTDGTDRAYSLAKAYGIKTAWGTDTLFDPQLATRQGQQLTKMTRWFSSAQILRMATFENAQLLALSGARNPYPGTLGVVEEGALADALLVRGDPLADIELLADPESSLAVIIKDGQIVVDRTHRASPARAS
jgi:imidazolonepropionase-like amidohydrolase